MMFSIAVIIEVSRCWLLLAGGIQSLRTRSDHSSISVNGIINAFAALSAASRPPEMHAAPKMASATSATVWEDDQ